jgi:hypothetical protein
MNFFPDVALDIYHYAAASAWLGTSDAATGAIFSAFITKIFNPNLGR